MKMSMVICTAIGVAAAACAPSSPQSTTSGSAADSAAIRALATSYATTFSQHDAAAMANLMTADYEEVDPNGTHLVGRAVVIDSMKAQFAQVPAGVAMTDNTAYIRFLSPTSAVAGGTWTVSPAAPGVAARGAWMAAVVKQDSTWLIASSLGADDDAAAMAAMRDTAKSAGKKAH